MNLREFGSWGLEKGQVANPQPNNKYLGQCVSLVQQYLYKVFNIPFKAHGNAKDWAVNIPDGFEKLSANTPLQRGDILVYGSNYGGGYGHIGFIDSNWKFYDQNGVKSLYVGYRDKPFNGYICVLRKQGGVDCGDVVTKTVEEIADEVIAQKWGNGQERKDRLSNAGYDYNVIQNIVNNKLIGNTSNLKSIDDIAREVIRGDWGVGQDRKNRLTNAGYNYTQVQNRVNRLL